jgi:hypothetical protein
MQMLATTYSETGEYQKAVITAQRALELAVLQGKDDMATALRGDITRYQIRIRQATGPGTAKQP